MFGRPRGVLCRTVVQVELEDSVVSKTLMPGAGLDFANRVPHNISDAGRVLWDLCSRSAVPDKVLRETGLLSEMVTVFLTEGSGLTLFDVRKDDGVTVLFFVGRVGRFLSFKTDLQALHDLGFAVKSVVDFHNMDERTVYNVGDDLLFFDSHFGGSGDELWRTVMTKYRNMFKYVWNHAGFQTLNLLTVPESRMVLAFLDSVPEYVRTLAALKPAFMCEGFMKGLTDVKKFEYVF